MLSSSYLLNIRANKLADGLCVSYSLCDVDLVSEAFQFRSAEGTHCGIGLQNLSQGSAYSLRAGNPCELLQFPAFRIVSKSDCLLIAVVR